MSLENKIENDDIVLEINEKKDKIIIIENPDKRNDEKNYNGRNMANIMSPARIMMVGPPNSGKGMIVSNILMKSQPYYNQIKVWHVDKHNTTEWDDMVHTRDDIIENINELHWDDDNSTIKKKKMLIIDDINLRNVSKETTITLNKLFAFGSSHSFLTIIVLVQDNLQITPTLRRLCNVFFIWPIIDVDACRILGRRVGLSKLHWTQIMKKMVKRTDFLMVNLTKDAHVYSKNIYQKITIPE
jgi:hypothetical protein